jgi:uncharacterized hydrophobic protein (TIGR00271 family)
MRRILIRIREITNLSDHIDILSTAESIKKGIDFRGPNVWILAFAIIVASVGLNINSIPVIIGAMLISPLMGPIMGVGLAVGTNDSKLLQQSLKNLLIMVSISLLASFTYFLISPLHLETPSELLARTRPTVFDVFIALFGGLAGIVESARKEKGTVIAGVAIATALMPPLCTAGYGLANAQWGHFIGAFYLFLINSFFIALATFLMVRYMKFPQMKFNDPDKQRRVHRTIFLFSAITVIPSIIVAWMVIRENRFEQTVDKFIKEYASLLENTQFINVDKTYRNLDSCEISLSVIGQPLSAFQVNQMKKRMQDMGFGKTRLVMRQSVAFGTAGENETVSALIQNVYDRYETDMKTKDERIAELERELSVIQAEDFPYRQVARELAVGFPALRKITLSKGMYIDIASGTPVEQVTAIVSWSGKPDREEVTKLENWLEVRLNVQNMKVILYSE